MGRRGRSFGDAADSRQRAVAAAQPTNQLAPYAGEVLGSLTVTPVRNSRLVETSLLVDRSRAGGRHGQRAREGLHPAEHRDAFSASKVATDWLSERLADQRKKVEESEVALQKYKEQHDAVAVEDRQNIVVQRLADLNGAATKAKMGRIEKESEYNQIKAVQGTPAIETVPAVMSNEYIQKLKSQIGDLQRQEAQLADKYGDRHPEMVKIRTARRRPTQAKLDSEINKVVESVKRRVPGGAFAGKQPDGRPRRRRRPKRSA